MLSTPSRVPVIVILVAGGKGTRMGEATPKQFLSLGGRPVYFQALEAFARHPMVDAIVLVGPVDDLDRLATETAAIRSVRVTAGGGSRQASVAAGLVAARDIAERESAAADAIVLIHDAARPFVPEALITRAIDAAQRHGAAVPVLPVADTIKTVDADGRIITTLDRGALRAVQTPQAFRLSLIAAAHGAATTHASLDDAALVEGQGHPVATFEGDPLAFKLTTPDDLSRARAQIDAGSFVPRTGIGFDVHRTTDGDHVTLCGVRIPHDRGLLGHSDADVGLHALADALYAALGEGDIGRHFPPSELRWKGADSRHFLHHAAGLVTARGGRITHLSVVILAEAPRIGPYREAMRQAVADAAGLALEAVGITATTTEGLGFTGRREGLAAIATASILMRGAP